MAWVHFPELPDDPQHEKAKKYLKGKGNAMVVFGIKSEDAEKTGAQFINSLHLHSQVANVGDACSLAIHPASTTHLQLSKEGQHNAGIV